MKVNDISLTWNRANCFPTSVDNEVEGSLILYFLASCLGNWVNSEEEGCLILYFIFFYPNRETIKKISNIALTQ